MSTSTDYLNSPFARMQDVPRFSVTSTDVKDGEPLDLAQASALMGIEGGQDRSPELSWSGAPEGTQAYAVTCFDPDAPTSSGFWHWMVTDIPADVTSLPANAGDPDAGLLPEGAVMMRNDAGSARYIGAAPPQGHGPHRYFFIVHALSKPLGLDADAVPTFVSFNMFGNSLGRAWIETTFEVR